MAFNTQPVFYSTPIFGSTISVTADTSETAPTITSLLVTASNPEGVGITSITLQPVGTNVATVFRLFVYDGSNYRCILQRALAATTAASTAAQTNQVISTKDLTGDANVPFVLPNGHSLRCTIGTSIATGVVVAVNGFLRN